MNTIKIAELLKDSTFPEAGAKLYELLCQRLGQAEPLVLDMDGVSSLPSMFLNTSFGQYIENHGKETLGRIRFQRISQQQAQRIKEYVSRFATHTEN